MMKCEIFWIEAKKIWHNTMKAMKSKRFDLEGKIHQDSMKWYNILEMLQKILHHRIISKQLSFKIKKLLNFKSIHPNIKQLSHRKASQSTSNGKSRRLTRVNRCQRVPSARSSNLRWLNKSLNSRSNKYSKVYYLSKTKLPQLFK